MDAAVNPLLAEWSAPFGLPPFGEIRPAHFKPAFLAAMACHRDETRAIAQCTDEPSFDNTVAAFDAAGRRLGRLQALFYALTASATSPELQAVQREMAAPLAAHDSAIYMDTQLFGRIYRLWTRREQLAITAPQRRLLERLHLEFERSGVRLDGAEREAFANNLQRQAELSTAFAQNVLHDESSFALPLSGEADLAGLPESLRAAARQAAVERGLDVGHAITLARALVVPFLSFSQRRDLRERVWRAWVERGMHEGEHDNRPIARELLSLRARQAHLLGYASFADYALADTMAGTTGRVWALLDEVWVRAKAALAGERALLECAMQAQGVEPGIEAWDWRYWAEQVRRSEFALDEAELKNYFALPNMVQALFDCAQRLFGLSFVARTDVQAYHPDVKAYEVFDAQRGSIGLFLHDNFARATKRSGAWMSALRWQHRNGGTATPVILNNSNFARGAPGEPALLSLDDVRTLFHEFGHGLHGLLSDVDYERQSGTQVLRDFVELPSQLFEHWLSEPQVLARYARHWRSGAPIPPELLQRIAAARRFGQAYETVRYTASAIVDMAAHSRAEPIADVVAFEAEQMSARGLPAAVGMNHRLPHFQHLFAGSSYAAGYYVYLWAEVLDADAYAAFEEAGDPFDRGVATRLRRCIYASGDSMEPQAAYLAFRGREATLEPMLRKKGLVPI